MCQLHLGRHVTALICLEYYRSKLEAEAWKELSDSYDAHRKAVQAEMEKRRRALTIAKSKGKERASAEDLDDWDVERRDLPEQFLSSGSVDRARTIVYGDTSQVSALQARLKDLEYTVRHLTPVTFCGRPHTLACRWTGCTPSQTRRCKPRECQRPTSIVALHYSTSRFRPDPSLVSRRHIQIPLRSHPTFRQRIPARPPRIHRIFSAHCQGSMLTGHRRKSATPHGALCARSSGRLTLLPVWQSGD